jgi:4-amino-4-deoxy-L-arabinose transferase-like glycosyltransferase
MRRAHWLVGVLAVLAFAQTLAYYAYLLGDPGNYNSAGQQGDQVAYVELAQQVLHGIWQGAVHYMPGLPAVIALGQVVFGDPRLGIAVVHGLVYAALVVAAAWLARQAFGAPTAPWAAGLVALNPTLGYYASQALTEFLTGAVLFALAVAFWRRNVVLGGLLIGAACYLRAEYLALAPLFGLLVLWTGRRRLATGLLYAGLLVVVTGLVIAPWVVRNALVTGRPALYNESPFSNLVLMGTWFRVFDEQTFTQLQQIETAAGPREQAIERAREVGPRPELSVRYMQQTRGPYERPLDETLALAAENVRLNTRQYVVNHLVLAPVLIWAGRTPVRQADAPRLPASARYAIWGAELALLLLALWQAGLSLRDSRSAALGLAFLAVVVFLTAVHVLIAVDERFTTPALPLVGLFAGARIGLLLAARRRVAVSFAC